MKNKIKDLRNHLFVAIEALLDDDKPMDIDRAKTVADVAQVMINSAKVEVELMKVTGWTGSDFFENAEYKPALLAVGEDAA